MLNVVSSVYTMFMLNITISDYLVLQVRMAALGVLNALFDGTKQFLMVAEDRFVIIYLY